MYAIVGATGNTGRIIAASLLAKGKKVRVIGRSADRLARLVEQGAEPFVADSMENPADVETMARAFKGAQAVYYLLHIPANRPDFAALGRAIGEALNRAGVTHAVVLGSLGAHVAANTGHYSDYYQLEQAINASATSHVLHLRPNFFLENLIYYIPEIKSHGTISTAFRSDLRVPHIAIRDIATVAADALAKLEFQGKTALELLGQRDLSMTEICSVIGDAIGKHVQPVQLSYDEMARRSVAIRKVTEDMGKHIAQMYAALNEGRITWPNPPAIRTSTSIEAFVAQEIVPRYNAH